MKKLKVKNIEVEGSVSAYGLDIESELTKILSEELTKSIDRDILMSLGIEPDKNKRRKNKINKIFNLNE